MNTLLTKYFELLGRKTANYYYYWHANEFLVGLPETQIN